MKEAEEDGEGILTTTEVEEATEVDGVVTIPGKGIKIEVMMIELIHGQ